MILYNAVLEQFVTLFFTTTLYVLPEVAGTSIVPLVEPSLQLYVLAMSLSATNSTISPSQIINDEAGTIVAEGVGYTEIVFMAEPVQPGPETPTTE